MTPDELREIDARIAVAFFGWRWVRWMKDDRYSVLFPPHLLGKSYSPCDESVKRAAWWDDFGLPDFTTDPAAATMLWDKLLEAHAVNIHGNHGIFRVAIVNTRWQMSSWEAETWPLALCKAAMAMAEATGAKGSTV